MKERKNPKYDMEPRFVLLIMTMVCIFLIFFSYRFRNVFDPIRTRLNSFVIPLQKGITTIGASINNAVDNFEKVEELQKEIASEEERSAKLEEYEKYTKASENKALLEEIDNIDLNQFVNNSSGERTLGNIMKIKRK